jgi:hypothetical protein
MNRTEGIMLKQTHDPETAETGFPSGPREALAPKVMLKTKVAVDNFGPAA